MTTIDRENLIGPREYTRYWVQTNGLAVSELGTIACPDSKSFEDYLGTLILDYSRDLAIYNAGQAERPKSEQKPIRGVGERLLKVALTEHLTHHRIYALENKKSDLAYRGANDLVADWVRAVSGSNASALQIAAMQHFVWQTKRKLNNLPVKQHLMPVLVGLQNSGKSTAVQALLAPLGDYTMVIDLDEVADKNNHKEFSKRLVVFTDEMGGSDKADIKKLKRQITVSKNTVRTFFTQGMETFQSRVTFIGASNDPINEILYDPTGMRRFYQLDTLAKIDWESVNRIDYLTLWQGIDENRDEGYIGEHLTELFDIQQSYVTPDPVTSFCRENGVEPCPDGVEPKVVSIDELYRGYTQYCDTSGHKPVPKNWFGTKLTNKGINSSRIERNGQKVNVRFISPNSGYAPADTRLELIVGGAK